MLFHSKNFPLVVASGVSVNSEVLIEYLCIPNLTSEADWEMNPRQLSLVASNHDCTLLGEAAVSVHARKELNAGDLPPAWVRKEEHAAWGRKLSAWVKKCSLSAQLWASPSFLHSPAAALTITFFPLCLLVLGSFSRSFPPSRSLPYWYK